MEIAHDTTVWASKTLGLFYLIGFSIGVVIYTYWPSNKKRFERAAKSIFRDKDEPCP